MSDPQTTLAAVSDEALEAELARRHAAREAAYWKDRYAKGAYFCAGCGAPDSYHTINCPTDTDCT